MTNLNGWEIALLAVAAYVAIVTLVGLMRKRRDQLTADLREQVEKEKKRLKDKKQKAKG